MAAVERHVHAAAGTRRRRCPPRPLRNGAWLRRCVPPVVALALCLPVRPARAALSAPAGVVTTAPAAPTSGTTTTAAAVVPSVLDLTVAPARVALTTAGLVLETTTASGTVVRQSPAPGAVVARGSRVRVETDLAARSPSPAPSRSPGPTTPPPSATSAPTTVPPPASGPAPGSTPTASPRSTATPAPDELREWIDRAVAALESGSVAFRPPRRMREGEPREFVVRVQRDSAQVDPSTLPGTGPVVQRPIEVGTPMSGELLGDGFDIEPAAASARVLSSSRPAEWTWTLTPTSFGEKQLRLRLTVLLDEADPTPLVPVREYVQTIEVRVDPLHTAVRVAKTAAGLMTGAGLTAAALAGAAWSWWRRRRPAAGAAGEGPPQGSLPGSGGQLGPGAGC